MLHFFLSIYPLVNIVLDQYFGHYKDKTRIENMLRLYDLVNFPSNATGKCKT